MRNTRPVLSSLRTTTTRMAEAAGQRMRGAAIAGQRWGARPRSRLTMTGFAIVAALALTVGTGWYAVARQAEAGPRQAAPRPSEVVISAPPGGVNPPLPPLPLPSGPLRSPAATSAPVGTAPPTKPGATASSGQRPADALAGWANAVAPSVDIPVPAMEAYGYAELYMAREQPSCHLAWTTLAGLGRIESDHGRAGGATLGADGRPVPPIRGLPLDGQGGRKLILDTDQGRLDGDTRYDRAIGPMQFIPSTWMIWGVDADNDGVADPNDIFDASLAAARYLCADGRDLGQPAEWANAVLSYNAVDTYMRDVFAQADLYGRESQGQG